MTSKGTRIICHHTSQQQHWMQEDSGVIHSKHRNVAPGILYPDELSLKCKRWNEDILIYTKSENVYLPKACFKMLGEDKDSFQENAKNIESILVSAQAENQIILDCSSWRDLKQRGNYKDIGRPRAAKGKRHSTESSGSCSHTWAKACVPILTVANFGASPTGNMESPNLLELRGCHCPELLL